jgi:hypothetical protein
MYATLMLFDARIVFASTAAVPQASAGTTPEVFTTVIVTMHDGGGCI